MKCASRGAYLLAFVPPAVTLAFLMTAPHRWYAGLAVALLAIAFAALDGVRTPIDDRSTAPTLPRGDAILLGLALLEAVNLALLVRAMMMPRAVWETAVAIVLTGTATAQSAIVVAHELVHRRSRFHRALGRALLWAGLYDHFYVEHLRGHHVRVASGADPAAARLGESFWRFVLRSLPGELASAWRLSPRQVALGMAAEGTLAVSIGLLAGPRALPAFVAQAAVTGLLISAVNYLQHFGAGQGRGRMTPADAWDCDSPLTHYALLGLSRHADHHLRPSRTFAELRPSPASPKLPHGYLRMVGLVLFRSGRARDLLAGALRRQSHHPDGASLMPPLLGATGGAERPRPIG